MHAEQQVLTPDAMEMMAYNVRQLKDALDVLLFDRRSRQAPLTAAGKALSPTPHGPAVA